MAGNSITLVGPGQGSRARTDRRDLEEMRVAVRPSGDVGEAVVAGFETERIADEFDEPVPDPLASPSRSFGRSESTSGKGLPSVCETSTT